jgi:DNA segregation ATPase FtsK/SpoIIIE, S-DNA-T family
VARVKKAAGRPKQMAWKRPVAGILLAGIALVALLGLWSYGPRAPLSNWAGPVGYTVAGALLEVAGVGAYAAALFLLAVSIALVAGRPRVSFSSSSSWVLFCLSLIALVHLGVRARLQGHAPGGLLGALIAGGAQAALSTWGAAVLIGAIGAASLVVATDLWALRAAFAAGRLGFAGGARAVKGAAGALSRARASGAEDDEVEDFEADPDVRITVEPRGRDAALRLALDAEAPQDPRLPVPPASDPGRKKKPNAVAPSNPPAALGSVAGEALPMAPTIVEPRPPAPRGGARKDDKKEDPESASAGFTLHGGRKSFTPPPIGILTGEVTAIAPIDREGLTATAEKLRQKLASFGIQGQVTQIRPGPVVTMFEFLPAAGVKVSRIASLADDLAMAMEALRVRIVAPIPGRGVVGIEVPNKERQMVVLRELAEQDAFQKSHSKLAMCLGKDIEGMPYIADLAKMPHLLIAGTTGSGKSVAVNSMIVSMLLRASPEEVRFLMVDPKMLELSVYEGIPHLLLPVVTDAKKAAMALRWGVEEMERRYQLLAECGVRNIASYNKKVEKEGDAARRAHKPAKEKRVVDLTDPQLSIPDLQQAAAAGEVARQETDNPAVQLLRENERKLSADGEEGAAEAAGEAHPAGQEPLRKLPYLVIIIDELADLMMVASREVETYIARLAQMARAAGIHLMVATQRPSTDVVTGVIKANFPARISFQVASRHDSGTIINAPGAENLLGMGDMLILPPGTSTLTRVHGPYVEEKEIHAVVEHWKAQGAPVYDPNILKPRAEDGDGLPEDDAGPDELYDQAIAAVSDMRFISISLLQRKLRVGYNRAARMIERMERDGIVGPADGAKPREVLIRALGELPGAGA